MNLKAEVMMFTTSFFFFPLSKSGFERDVVLSFLLCKMSPLHLPIPDFFVYVCVLLFSITLFFFLPLFSWAVV